MATNISSFKSLALESVRAIPFMGEMGERLICLASTQRIHHFFSLYPSSSHALIYVA